MSRGSTNKRLIAVLSVIALLVAARWGYLTYKRLTGYPGEFLLVYGWDACKMDAAGVRELGWGLRDGSGWKTVISHGAWYAKHCQHTRSPNGRLVAYLVVDPDPGQRVISIATRPVGWPNMLGLTYDNVAARNSENLEKMVHWVDTAKYDIPFHTPANLAWSPDGKYVAYATGTALYVMDVAARKLHVAELPVADAVSRLCEASREFERSLPPPTPVPPSKDGLTGVNQTHPGIKPDSYFKPDDFHLRQLKPHQERLNRMVEESNRRFATALGLSQSDSPADRDLYKKDVAIFDGKESWPLRLTADGRTLTWVSQNTLYCDNWKLKVDVGKTGVSVVSATETKLPSTVFVRPLWNQQGDKAIYCFSTTGTAKKPGATRLIVVNSKGKTIWQTNPEKVVDSHEPRWSRDGNYLVTLHSGGGTWWFRIFEVGTSRSWTVPRPPDRVTFSDWDWRK